MRINYINLFGNRHGRKKGLLEMSVVQPASQICFLLKYIFLLFLVSWNILFVLYLDSSTKTLFCMHTYKD